MSASFVLFLAVYLASAVLILWISSLWMIKKDLISLLPFFLLGVVFSFSSALFIYGFFDGLQRFLAYFYGMIFILLLISARRWKI